MGAGQRARLRAPEPARGAPRGLPADGRRGGGRELRLLLGRALRAQRAPAARRQHVAGPRHARAHHADGRAAAGLLVARLPGQGPPRRLLPRRPLEEAVRQRGVVASAGIVTTSTHPKPTHSHTPGWTTSRRWRPGRWTRSRCCTRRASCTATSAPPPSSSPRPVRRSAPGLGGIR